jgi:translation initiation factor 2 gamma subunit (eIF-2gamma)
MYVLGTAGHIDHGKSALVQALTGMDPDRLAEEKERGMTIDLGFAWLKLPGGKSESWMCPVTSGLCAICWPGPAESISPCS